jgi:hypothetical protein
VHCCLLYIGTHDVFYSMLRFASCLPAHPLTTVCRDRRTALPSPSLFFCVMALFSSPEVEPVYVYKGQEDDRPLLWRPHLNELVGVLGEVRPIEGNMHTLKTGRKEGQGQKGAKGVVRTSIRSTHAEGVGMYHWVESIIVPLSGSTTHSHIFSCRGMLARCDPESARCATGDNDSQTGRPVLTNLVSLTPSNRSF